MKRQRIFRDPTAARADVSPISDVLDTLDEAEATLCLLVVVLDQPLSRVTRLLQMSEKEAEAKLARVTSRLRHPSRSQKMNDELSDGPIPVSAELRSWAREISAALFHQCAQCEGPFVPSNSPRGGRPRRFCSDACRQAAYRKRRAAPAETPQQPSPVPRLPGRPKWKKPRSPSCSAHHNREREGLQIWLLGCSRYRGHLGQHLSLCQLKQGDMAWVSWESQADNLTRHALCAATSSAGSCVLPEGHLGTHLFGKAPFGMATNPWRLRGDLEQVHMGLDLATVVRHRLSAPPHVADGS